MIPVRTVVLLGLLAVTPAFADDRANCARYADPIPAIQACIRIIKKGGKTGRKRENLIIAYFNPGAASLTGDFDRAIADFDKAIQLKPDFAYAYAIRGAVYSTKGDFDHATADYERGHSA